MLTITDQHLAESPTAEARASKTTVQEAAGHDKRDDYAHPSGGIAHHGDLRRAVAVVLSLVAGCMFGPASRPFFK